MTTLPENARLAVLIDADNTSAKRAAALLEEVTKYGSATVRRAYADWTNEHTAKWKKQLNQHAIQPIQQFAYTTGKNATDFALVIDAMDLLYAGQLDGFVLVSSDSDFTRLATRLRESGKTVLGMGERKTPQAFRAACNRFIYLDLLSEPAADDSDAPEPTQASEPSTEPPALRPLLTQAIESTSQDDGWSALGSVGNHLVQNDPSFDPRLYGHSKLSNLVKAQGFVELREPGSGAGSTLWVRIKASGTQPTKKAATRKRTTKKASAEPTTTSPAEPPTTPDKPKVTQRTRSSARTR